MQGIIILDSVPKNCDCCDLHNHCGLCLVNDTNCDYDSDTRPESCPIIEDSLRTVPENEIAQLADQISRVHLISIQELKQRGLIHD